MLRRIFLGLFCILPVAAWGFAVDIHRDISVEQAGLLRATIAGNDEQFSSRALQELADANEAVDALSSAAQFFPARHFTNERVTDGFNRVDRLAQEALAALAGNSPDGRQARENIGQALHTIQDFYAHSNWAELGQTAVANSGNTGPTTGTCAANPNQLSPSGGGGLTTAYFVESCSGRLDCADEAAAFQLGLTDDYGCETSLLPVGKCFHGNYRAACVGINKDLSPVLAAAKGLTASPFHANARSAAERATTDFLQREILDQLVGQDKALAALLDVKGTLGFVVDDTGSMGDDIVQVQNIIQSLVSITQGLIEERPGDFLLTRFGDPSVGPTVVSEDPNVILQAAQALSPSGGGDCPELSQSGLLQAISNSRFGSRLITFTDATAKDSSLANSVISRAQNKEIVLRYSLTGSCSPIDPAYIRGAAETGGQVFLIDRDEVGQLLDLFTFGLRPDVSRVLTQSIAATSTPSVVTVPVDLNMRAFSVSVSGGSNIDMRIYRPDGSDATDDENINVTALSTAVIATIDNPVPGEWSIELTGSGELSVSVDGDSQLGLLRAEFVEANLDIHGGYFPIEGQVIFGEEATIQAIMIGPVASATFELLTPEGASLGIIDLSQNFPDAVQEYYLGELNPPNEPFRLSVSGVDEAGFTYRRQSPIVFRPQTVQVVIDAVSENISIGEPASINFIVTNTGESKSFNLAAVDDLGATQSVSPSSLDLGIGESATVTVELLVPESTPDDTSFELSLTVTDSSDVNNFNSASLSLTAVDLADNTPPVLAFAITPERIWPPNHKMVPITVSVVVEDDLDPAPQIVLESISVNQLDNGTGDGNTIDDIAGADYGTDDRVFEVRAERAGGVDRTYTITYRATDNAGNETRVSATVRVARR